MFLGNPKEIIALTILLCYWGCDGAVGFGDIHGTGGTGDTGHSEGVGLVVSGGRCQSGGNGRIAITVINNITVVHFL